MGGQRGWDENGAQMWTFLLDYNVGIGTNNPQARLHVVGNFYNQGATGIKSNYDPGVTSWTDVASRTITTHGTSEDSSIVLIFAHLQTDASAGYVDAFIRVVRDGNQVVGIASGGMWYGEFSGLWGYGGVTLISFDEPPSGTHTYTLQRESVIPQNGYQFLVIEIKR